MTPPLRYHLVFGPPGSGKTTVAKHIVTTLQQRGENAERIPHLMHFVPMGDIEANAVLDLDDAIVHSRNLSTMTWQQKLPESTAMMGVVTANACTRELRIQYPLKSNNGQPVEWIGWWLYTPVATCLLWNLAERWQGRKGGDSLSKEAVSELAGLLTDPQAPPAIEEGFSSLVHLDPSEFSNDRRYGTLSDVIAAILDDLDASCAEVAAMREGLSLHAYSCPADFERLMQGLVRAIWNREPRIAYQWLEPSDGSGFALSDDRDYCRLQGLWPPHQGGEQEAATPITVPPPRTSTELHRGGWHRFSDAQAFVAVMEELRQFLHGATTDQPPSAGLQGLIDRYGFSQRAGGS